MTLTLRSLCGLAGLVLMTMSTMLVEPADAVPLKVGMLFLAEDLHAPTSSAAAAFASAKPDSAALAAALALTELEDLDEFSDGLDVQTRIEVTEADLASALEDMLAAGVKTVFGGAGPDWRAKVTASLQDNEATLWSPFPALGECSSALVFAGGTTNQYLSPAVAWLVSRVPTAGFFVVTGSDDNLPLFTSTSTDTAAIVKKQLYWSGGTLAGSFVVDGRDNVDSALSAIAASKDGAGVDDVYVLSALPSAQTGELIRQMAGNNLNATAGFHVMGFQVEETDLYEVDTVAMDVLTSTSFFEGVGATSTAATEFAANMLDSGATAAGNTAEAMYNAVHLWAVRQISGGHFFTGPEGLVDLIVTNAVSRATRIGRAVAGVGPGVVALAIEFETMELILAAPVHPLLNPSADCNVKAQEGIVEVETISVGILHSVTGTLSFSERTVVDSELMAIDELNQAGGVLGKRVVPVFYDGASDWDLFADYATELTDRDDITSVFGCWTSSSRKSVLPIFEAADKLLWYPVQYEGQECSKNVFYSGATPNQQIVPSLDWLLKNKPFTEVFLVGSDYVFPRTANAVIKAYLGLYGGTAPGEMYIPLGSVAVDPILDEIQKVMPNGGIIYNTLNGDSNVAFFHGMTDRGMTPKMYPSMSVSIGEPEIASIGISHLQGHYASWNYFQTVDNGVNAQFVSKFKGLFGQDRVISDPMEAAYINVKVWSNAVLVAGLVDVENVRRAAYSQAVSAPEGLVVMNSNHHLRKYVRVGQVRADGLFDIVFEPQTPVEPSPWSPYIPETAGLRCNYADDSQGEQFAYPAVKVAIITTFSGAISLEQRAVVDSARVAARQINLNEILPGTQLDVVVFDDKGTPATAQAQLAAVFADESIPVVFVASPRAWALLLDRDGGTSVSAPRASQMVFGYGRVLSNGPCESNVVSTDPLPNQVIDPALQYLVTIGHDLVFVILAETTGPEIEDYFSASATELGVTEFEVVRLGFDGTAVELFKQAKLFCSRRCSVLNFLPADPSQEFFEEAVLVGGSTAQFLVINFALSLIEAKVVGQSLLQGSLFALTTVNALNSLEYDQILSAVRKDGMPDDPVTAQTESTHDLLTDWARAVSETGTTEAARISQFLYADVHSALVKSNHLDLIFYLTQLDFLGTSFELIYPTNRPGVVVAAESLSSSSTSSEKSCTFGPKNVIMHTESNALVYISFGIVIVVLSSIAAFTTYHRNTASVKAASFPFLMMALTALFFCCVSALLFAAMPTATNGVCVARIWLGALPPSALCACLFAKMHRLNKIFNNQKFTKKPLSNKALLKNIAFVSGVQTLLLVVWSASDSPTYYEIVSEEDSTFDTTALIPLCSESTMGLGLVAGYIYFLLCVGLVIAFRARNLPKIFNETQSISNTITIMIFLGTFVLPVNALLSAGTPSVDRTTSLVLINSVGMLLSTLVLSATIFVPVILRVLDKTSVTTLDGSSASGPGSKPTMSRNASAVVSKYKPGSKPQSTQGSSNIVSVRVNSAEPQSAPLVGSEANSVPDPRGSFVTPAGVV